MATIDANLHLRTGLKTGTVGVVRPDVAIGYRLAMAAGKATGSGGRLFLFDEIKDLERSGVSRYQIDEHLISLYSTHVSIINERDQAAPIEAALLDSTNEMVAAQYSHFWLGAYDPNSEKQWEGFHDSCKLMADLTAKHADRITPSPHFYLDEEMFIRINGSFQAGIYPGNFVYSKTLTESRYGNSLIAMIYDIGAKVPTVQGNVVHMLTQAYDRAVRRKDNHLAKAITNHLAPDSYAVFCGTKPEKTLGLKPKSNELLALLFANILGVGARGGRFLA